MVDEVGLIKIEVTRDNYKEKLVLEFSEDIDIQEWKEKLKVILRWVTFEQETIDGIFTEEE